MRARVLGDARVEAGEERAGARAARGCARRRGRRSCGSSRHESPRAARWRSTSLRETRSSGRRRSPGPGRMAPRPVAPAPRSRRKRTVSAWSSRVWATAMATACFLAPHLAQERVALAAGGVLEARPIARGAARARRPGRGGGRRPSRGTKPRAGGGVLGRARAAGRGRGARPPRGSPACLASQARASRSAVESAPPERPTTRASPRAGHGEAPHGLGDRRDERTEPHALLCLRALRRRKAGGGAGTRTPDAADMSRVL